MTYTVVPDGAEFDPDKVNPIRDRDRDPWVPRGGLWSAPPIDTDAEGVATTWTWFNDVDRDEEWGTLVPVTPAGGSAVVHVDTAEDLERLRALYPPQVFADPDADPDADLELDEDAELESAAPFSFEAMASSGIAGVHVTENAVKTLREFEGWDVASTVWVAPDRIVTRAPVPAARSRERPQIDDLSTIYSHDLDRWTVQGTYTLKQATDFGTRIPQWEFDSAEHGFQACRWFAAANPDSDSAGLVARHWESAHTQAKEEAESELAAAITEEQRTAAAAKFTFHDAEAAKHHGTFVRLLDARLEAVRRERDAELSRMS